MGLGHPRLMNNRETQPANEPQYLPFKSDKAASITAQIRATYEQWLRAWCEHILGPEVTGMAYRVPVMARRRIIDAGLCVTMRRNGIDPDVTELDWEGAPENKPKFIAHWNKVECDMPPKKEEINGN